MHMLALNHPLVRMVTICHNPLGLNPPMPQGPRGPQDLRVSTRKRPGTLTGDQKPGESGGFPWFSMIFQAGWLISWNKIYKTWLWMIFLGTISDSKKPLMPALPGWLIAILESVYSVYSMLGHIQTQRDLALEFSEDLFLVRRWFPSWPVRWNEARNAQKGWKKVKKHWNQWTKTYKNLMFPVAILGESAIFIANSDPSHLAWV